MRTEEGQVLRRNRCHLLKTNETFQETRCDDEVEKDAVPHTDIVPKVKSDEHVQTETGDVSSGRVWRRSERKTKETTST